MTASPRTCATCRHWTPPEEGEWGPVERTFGVCRYTPHSVDMTEWGGEDGTENVIIAEFRDRTAMVMDRSGYHAALLCREVHSCAMWSSADALTTRSPDTATHTPELDVTSIRAQAEALEAGNERLREALNASLTMTDEMAKRMSLDLDGCTLTIRVQPSGRIAARRTWAEVQEQGLAALAATEGR